MLWDWTNKMHHSAEKWFQKIYSNQEHITSLLATLIIEFFLMHRIQIDTELYKDIYADWLTLEMGRNKINKKQIVTTTFHLPLPQCYIRSENADSSLARVAFWLLDSYFRLFLFFILAFFLGWKYQVGSTTTRVEYRINKLRGKDKSTHPFIF